MVDRAPDRPARLKRALLSDEQQTRLAALLAGLRQGDVIRLPHFPVIGSPGATRLPETARAADAESRTFVTVDRPLSTGLFAVLTQTCDIRRSIGLEPFLVVAPLAVVPEDEWQACLHGRRGFRTFSYPYPVDGIRNLALEVRVCATVEKEALVAERSSPIVSVPVEAGFREELQAWLQARFGRHAFPDDLEVKLLRRFRTRWSARAGHASDDGRLIRSTDAVYVRYAENSASVELLLMVRAARLGEFGTTAAEVKSRLDAAIATLLKPIHASLEKAGSGLIVSCEARTPDRISAADLLYRCHQIDLA